MGLYQTKKLLYLYLEDLRLYDYIIKNIV